MMVEAEVAAAGIKQPAILAAMRSVPRHEFVPADLRQYAYMRHGAADRRAADDLAAVHRGLHDRAARSQADRQGAGDRHRQRLSGGRAQRRWSRRSTRSRSSQLLGERAAKTFKRLGYKNVTRKIGDGYQGWAEHAPFDKIIVTCSPEKVPRRWSSNCAKAGG